MTEQKFDLYRAIGLALRTGVLLAGLLCIVGLGVWAIAGYPAQGVLSSSNILDVFRLASQGDFSGIIYLGILLLIATPVFRVALSAVGFGIERDRNYVIISLLVLAMLLVGMFSGSVA